VPVENVKELLRKLVALQKIDAEVYEFKRGIKELPEQLNDVRAKYEKKQARYHEIEQRVREIELARKAKELDLKAREQDIIKANNVLMTLKTNKEYQAKLFEIENIKADQSVLEEEILKSFDESSKCMEEMTKEKAVVDEAEKAYLAEKEKVDAAVKALMEKVATFEAARTAALEGIDPATLNMYERLLENRHGTAIVPIVNDACGGCFMKQTEQMINQQKMCTQISRCEMCARILYLESEL
jgi:uncharacterized protein